MLKLGTHMDSGLMYGVYQNQGQGLITIRVTSLDGVGRVVRRCCVSYVTWGVQLITGL